MSVEEPSRSVKVSPKPAVTQSAKTLREDVEALEREIAKYQARYSREARDGRESESTKDYAAQAESCLYSQDYPADEFEKAIADYLEYVACLEDATRGLDGLSRYVGQLEAEERQSFIEGWTKHLDGLLQNCRELIKSLEESIARVTGLRGMPDQREEV